MGFQRLVVARTDLSAGVDGDPLRSDVVDLIRVGDERIPGIRVVRHVVHEDGAP
jgi:hypothetical protein